MEPYQATRQDKPVCSVSLLVGLIISFKTNIDVNSRFSKAGIEKIRTTKTKVLVVSGQKNMLEERMKLLSELWKENVQVSEFFKSCGQISLS